MLPAHERALRREVARLAILDPADLAAQLDALDPRHRDRIGRLLQEFANSPTDSGAPAAIPAWIDDRIAGRVIGMTERARSALAACAGETLPRLVAPSEGSTGKSLFDQALTALSGRKP